jgi:AraC-like DNA-binding protein
LDSFFFNITDKGYKITKEDGYKRVDISNGIIFFDIKKECKFRLKNLDQMVIITAVKSGEIFISDLKSTTSDIFCTSRQDFEIYAKGEIFILFVADFFLKRYLSGIKSDPIDLLYSKMEGEIYLERIDSHPINALMIYLVKKIIKIDEDMKSLRCSHRVVEFMIYRFSLIDLLDESVDEESLALAKRAKDILLNDCQNPPTIKELSHLCATNESKLKKVFKQVYKYTIYGYIQKLRLQKANLLLKDKELNIGQISKMVGYKHQGHFSKLYFDAYGVYPKELLKSR